jgi:type VI secretion system protein ImpL
MIRRLIFILFLYSLLVWILAYLYVPVAYVQTAMLWCAVGLATVLVGLIIERIVAWWRGRRAQQASKPAAPSPAATTPSHPARTEEAAAFSALLAEADRRLAEAPGAPGVRPPRVMDMPLFLVVGPPECGKTALMQFCGVEPVLLAGQALSPAGTVAPTRVANIWLVRQSVFIEIAGRVFDSGADGLEHLLDVLRGTPNDSAWRWFSPPQPVAQLRAAMLVCDAARYTGEPEAVKLDRMAQHARERLYSIARAFGADLPVYALFSKIDSVRGFTEFFARISEAEVEQVFGFLTADGRSSDPEGRVWAEPETKRLNRHFQHLILRLDDRRRLALSLEPDAQRKPAIYEFPREFKKIRTPLVQYLIDVFQPDPLRAGPRLAGLFFTGVLIRQPVRPAEPVASMAAAPGESDATQIFQGDATMVGKRSMRADGTVEQRAFTGELFEALIRHHPMTVRRVVRGSGAKKQQIALATAAATAVALFFGIVWTISWRENYNLIARTEKAIVEIRGVPADVSLASLTALDRLLQEIMTLESSDSWWRHWGLYKGGNVREIARRAYFEQLKRVSLRRIDSLLGAQLLSAGGETHRNPDQVYDRLKTYRTITGACTVDRPLVTRVLRTAAAEAHPGLSDARTFLLGRQLEYYIANLRPPPVTLDEDAAAEERARAYLRRVGGFEQQFRALLAAVEEGAGKLVVSQTVDYQGLMDGPTEISKAFTPKGMQMFEERVASGDSGASKDQCVMGDSGSSTQTSGKDELKARYYREYAAKWREFLAACRIRPYGSMEDSATRLRNLADASRSPLLDTIKLVAVNAAVAGAKSESSLIDVAKQKIGLKDQKVNAALDSITGVSGGGAITRSDLQTRLLQPALWIVPPPFDHPVNENDGAYVKSLRDLGDAIAALARSTLAEKPAKVQDAQTLLAKAREAHSGLVDKFSDAGSSGVAEPIAELLMQPIRLAESMIAKNRDTSGIPQKDADVRRLCGRLKPLLSSYPFSPGESAKEISLKDLKDAFAPKSGWIWQYAESADFVARQGSEWQEKPGLAGFKVAPELIGFLNAAQRLANALFVNGEPRLDYTLRPCTAHPECDGQLPIKMTLDGKEMQPNSAIRVQFHWPAAPGERMGAEGFRVFSSGSNGFGSFDGLWGVFRLFQYADKRPLGTGRIVWSEIRGLGNARPQRLDPSVKIDLLGVTPNTDVLNPSFFEGLQPASCPTRAAIPN